MMRSMVLRGYLADPLRSTDDWFGRVIGEWREAMKCGRGCTLCCYGLFDIFLPEAMILAAAIERLPAVELSPVRTRAATIQARIESVAPELRFPFLLTAVNDERVAAIVEAVEQPRCPLLTDDGGCSVCERRPLACRLEGAPLVDTADGLFGDWCELNFTSGVPDKAHDVLRRDYYALQQLEEAATAEASRALWGVSLRRATIFIPSLVSALDEYWRPLLQGFRE